MSTEVGTGKGTTVRFAEDNPQKKSKGKFKTSVEIVSNLPASGPLRPSDEEKLLFYALYKQATIGPCNTQQPAFYEVVSRAKWDSWKNLKNISKSEAMQQYTTNLLKVLNRNINLPEAKRMLQQLGVEVPTIESESSETPLSNENSLSTETTENPLFLKSSQETLTTKQNGTQKKLNGSTENGNEDENENENEPENESKDGNEDVDPDAEELDNEGVSKSISQTLVQTQNENQGVEKRRIDTKKSEPESSQELREISSLITSVEGDVAKLVGRVEKIQKENSIWTRARVRNLIIAIIPLILYIIRTFFQRRY